MSKTFCQAKLKGISYIQKLIRLMSFWYYFTWRTDIFPPFDIFTFCTFFWKVHIFISRKEWIDSINYLIKIRIFLVFIIFFELAISTPSATLQAGDLIDQVDRERGANRNQSRGIQFIHAKRLTRHTNARYTLLIMDSWVGLLEIGGWINFPKGPVTLRNFLSNLSRNGWKFSVASCRGLVLKPCYTVQSSQQLVSQCSYERKTKNVRMRPY